MNINETLSDLNFGFNNNMKTKYAVCLTIREVSIDDTFFDEFGDYEIEGHTIVSDHDSIKEAHSKIVDIVSSVDSVYLKKIL